MLLKYDGPVDIATAGTRRAQRWKNKTIHWSELVTRFSNTHRTAETLAEYMAATKTRQDEIKDIGGFVGGYLAGGKRKADSVMHRQLITLDVDFGIHNVWEDFCLLYPCAAAVYSTHKHTAEKPRLRLVIPLSREVLADEYTAISRRIAGDVGIELFDPTTFQASRLMYWPSTSSDGEYVFHFQDGEWLDADAVLATYRDWRDSSAWPTSVRQDAEILARAKLQGDPLEKPGVVGAFCRVYDIHEALSTFLSEAYTESAIEGRYTYANGSTGAGLVTYDDKFAYSHHGTDPASGKLCNAFDLVRLHKFGDRDSECKPETPAGKRPSFAAMAEFATKLPEVRKLIAQEKISSAADDFAEVVCEGEESTDWLAELSVDKNGDIRQTIENVVLILENDPRLKGCYGRNEFRKAPFVRRSLPWRTVGSEGDGMRNADDAALRHYLEKVYGISGRDRIYDAMEVVLSRHAFHPVREYLESLVWDGTRRLDSLLIDYLGAEDGMFVRAATRKTLVGAVARIFEPGRKFDTVLSLVGAQGRGKSTLVAKLGGKWFSDSFGGVEGNRACEALEGVWLMEIGELAGMKRAQVEEIKQFISKPDDSYRAAYARQKETHPRQCIFFATTNQHDFLKDATGNRRFWPVEVGVREPRFDLWADFSEYVRGQVWAEAVERYQEGESLYMEEDLRPLAEEAQELHYKTDPRQELVEKYLNTLLPSNWESLGPYERRAWLASDGDTLRAEGAVKRGRVCVLEVWVEAFGCMVKDLTIQKGDEIRAILDKVKGWKKHKGTLSFGYLGTQRAYVRK